MINCNKNNEIALTWHNNNNISIKHDISMVIIYSVRIPKAARNREHG
jgi:hypothetical protein